MARNLQAKLPSSDTIRVFDINAESVKRFANETKALGNGAAVKIAANVREAAEDSVSLQKISFKRILPALPRVLQMMNLFSNTMI